MSAANASADFLMLVIRLSVPLILAALSATVAERSGVVCLGVEGMMLIGAFFGVLGAHLVSPWFGVVFGILSGALIGLVYGIFGVLLHGNQSVVGLAINLFAEGITPLLCEAFFGKEGASSIIETIPNWTVPGLSAIPVIGKFFTGVSPYIFLTMLTTVFLYVIFYKTKYGLRLRAIGDNPMGVQTQGVNTNMYKLCAMVLAGAIAGLGGAYLSTSFSNVFVKGMVAGRGFMGVAANIFGGWTVIGSVLAALFFGTVQTIRYYILGTTVSTHLIQMLPYAATLIALVIFGRNSRSPEGAGQTVK